MRELRPGGGLSQPAKPSQPGNWNETHTKRTAPRKMDCVIRLCTPFPLSPFPFPLPPSPWQMCPVDSEPRGYLQHILLHQKRIFAGPCKDYLISDVLISGVGRYIIIITLKFNVVRERVGGVVNNINISMYFLLLLLFLFLSFFLLFGMLVARLSHYAIST